MESLEIESGEVATVNLSEPVRILVQSSTHLVPGKGFFEKCRLLQNNICQYHWNRDFDPRQHRWVTHNADFAFPNRRCFFLLDSGKATEDDVPILSYEWTGNSLIPKPELAQWSKIQRILKKEFPFSNPLQNRPKDKGPEREFIRSILHQGVPLADRDFKHIREHPEDAKWLKNHLEPRLWKKLEDGLRHLEQREKEIAEGTLIERIIPYDEWKELKRKET